jgi:hypothetical protein
MYIVLSYATYVLLAVIASALLFAFGLVVVVVQEAFRVVHKTSSRVISLEKRGGKQRRGFFDRRSTAEARGSFASTAKSWLAASVHWI